MKAPGFAISLLVIAMAFAPAGDQQGPSIQAQAPREPLDYFREMMPVFTHARCLNCHGAVNPFSGMGHGGGVIDQVESCTSSCHTQADNDNRTGLDDWHLPPPERFFVGKDVRALCAQMADRVMHDGSQHFIDHLQSDLQIDLGFVGMSGGAREDPQPQQPPMRKDQFLVAAALWLDEGLGACDRDGTITHTEVLESQETLRPAPNMETRITQTGRRTVTLSLANGRYTAEVDVKGQVTLVQTMTAAVNGQPCTTIITSISDYEDASPPSGTGRLSPGNRVVLTVAPGGEYTIMVHLGEERHRQTDHGALQDGCNIGLPRSPPETLEQVWPPTVIKITGRLPNPRDQSRLVGASTRNVNQRVGPDDDPWFFDHYGASSAQDGTLHVVNVMTSWNLRYRP